MPFIKQAARLLYPSSTSIAGNLERAAEQGEPGDRCFVYYRELLRVWKAAPRWTTAHNLYRRLIETVFWNSDDKAAAYLAWQVFFELYVMDYERKKREENGEVL